MRHSRVAFLLSIACAIAAVPCARAGDAPQWMHAVVSAPLPAHDEKTDAVLLYEDIYVNVISADKVKTHVRRVYKILRPGGREYGVAAAWFNVNSKINGFHGWCIPAQGKDFEVKDKDAVDVSAPEIDGSELISDVKYRFLRIPAAEVGNVLGFEYEKEEQPLLLQEVLHFQEEIPAREIHYTLQLPAGWEYRAAWLNYEEVKPTSGGNNSWQWTLNNVAEVRPEPQMPPGNGVMGKMIVYLFPPGGAGTRSFADWKEMGLWYKTLTAGRRQASPEITKEVNTLTGSAPTQLEKMTAVAQFMQRDIRYVAISLGIGGVQPHPAADVFAHRYGDCKDKATLMSSMLHEMGVESFYVVINMERDAVRPGMPAHDGFDHVVLAIRLPDGVKSPTLVSTMEHPKLGRLLFFDPTNETTPFGEIGGYLQANYGLLVTPDGGELVELPRQPASMNSIERTATLTLDPTGTLKGDVKETRLGDRAWTQRSRLRAVTKSEDRIKPIEEVLAGSLSLFQITHATILNLTHTDQPFGLNYSFVAQDYAKNAGGLLLVRPRVLGVNGSGLLETKEPRRFPIEFEGPSRDTDSFDIAIPSGYVVDGVPPPVDADYGFASYHSKTEVKGNLIHYTRTMEVKELSVPINRADELKKFYRLIAGDERNTVVLKAAQ